MKSNLIPNKLSFSGKVTPLLPNWERYIQDLVDYEAEVLWARRGEERELLAEQDDEVKQSLLERAREFVHQFYL